MVSLSTWLRMGSDVIKTDAKYHTLLRFDPFSTLCYIRKLLEPQTVSIKGEVSVIMTLQSGKLS